MRSALATTALLLALGGGVFLFGQGGPPAPASAAASPPVGAATPAPERLAPPPEVIDESSGLAASHARPGWLWTCNDSAGGERLARYDPADPRGEAAEVFTLAGAANRDWEDLASFEVGGRCFLLVADVGDNQRNRRDATLHFVEEPAADADPATPLPVLLSVPVAFADGARDCEAVAVDTSRSVVLLGSKEIDQHGRTHGTSGLYELPLPEMPAEPAGRERTTRIERVADLPTLMPTGMDVSPDGSLLAICTYGDAMVFRCAPGDSWAGVVEGEPQRPRTPPRRQGEAVAFGLDGKSLYFTSEGATQPTWKISIE